MKGAKRMKLVVQRVKHASVEVENEIVGKIEQGFLVLLGVTHTDTKETADYLVKKLCNLRVFEDENQKMNLSIKDVQGKLLIVSQFTLYADCSGGNRPSFVNALCWSRMRLWIMQPSSLRGSGPRIRLPMRLPWSWALR